MHGFECIRKCITGLNPLKCASLNEDGEPCKSTLTFKSCEINLE